MTKTVHLWKLRTLEERISDGLGLKKLKRAEFDILQLFSFFKKVTVVLSKINQPGK